MTLYFITGSAGKFKEAQAVLPELQQLDLDLPEIQEIDAQKIIAAKLTAAQQHHAGSFIVEDTSLAIASLNGLPGPLIKWFLKKLGNDGLARIARSQNTSSVSDSSSVLVNAEARTVIGYVDEQHRVSFFEGVIKGSIILPRGERGFGWDPIFVPEGFDRSFAEMTLEEKNQLSMRRLAFNKLKQFLLSREQ